MSIAKVKHLIYFPFHILSPIPKKSYTSCLIQKKPKCIRFGDMYIINNVSSDLFLNIFRKFNYKGWNRKAGKR